MKHKLSIKKEKTKQITEYNCDKCGLSSKCKRPKIGWDGNNNHNLLFLDDAPNQDTDGGQGFFSGSIRLKTKRIELKKKLKDIPKGYAVQCFPGAYGGFSHLSETHVRCCRAKMVEMINEIKPTAIISFGEYITNSLLNTSNKISIERLRGRVIPLHEFGCVLMPTFNAKEFRTYDEEEDKFKSNYQREKACDLDLELYIDKYLRAYKNRMYVKKFLEKRNILKNIEIHQIKSISSLINLSEILREKSEFAFDYETTNNKPFDDFFEIVSLCFAHDKTAWVVYLDDFKGDITHAKHITMELLNNINVTKIIQNKQFEELCTRWWCKDILEDYPRDDLGQYIRNYYDIMLATHVLDERAKCTALDFQTLTRFGIPSFYSEHKMEKWIAVAKDQKVNKIKECPKDLLIEYTAHDGIESYHNWRACKWLEDQTKQQWGIDFISKGSDVFANMTERGIPINEKRRKKLSKQLEDIQDEIQKKIEIDKDVIAFEKKRGKSLNVQSSKQMRDFLYNFLKLKPVKKTKGGKKGTKEDSTDKDVILHHAEVDNVGFCRLAVKKKKFKKALDVLSGIYRFTNLDKKMHPNFWMNTTETIRSSSSDLNFQNIPVHGFIIEDEDYKIPWEIVREVFEREEGYIIAEIDFERNEVVGAANLSQDKQLIEDINTDFDMHSHWTNVIFGFNHSFDAYKKDVTEEDKYLSNLRYLTKNNWTFANFYKAGAKSIAKSFRGFPVYLNFLQKEYEKKKQIVSFDRWIIKRSEEHIAECQKFFYDRYSGFKSWQDELIQSYYADGYIETPLGFRRHYPLQTTEIVNYPIQSTSYHILLDACIRIEKRTIKEKRKSTLRAQIHDSAWMMIWLPEILEIIDMVNYEMINHNLPGVPKLAKLGTDWKVGVNWGQMKKISSLL